MQLLHILDIEDYDQWKADYDNRVEDRMNAGLTLLQMWHDADTPKRVLCLYNINDRGKADSFLDKSTAIGAQVTGSHHHFLRTA